MTGALTVGEVAAREGWFFVVFAFVVFCVGSYHTVRIVTEWAERLVRWLAPSPGRTP